MPIWLYQRLQNDDELLSCTMSKCMILFPVKRYQCCGDKFERGTSHNNLAFECIFNNLIYIIYLLHIFAYYILFIIYLISI